MGVWEFGSSGVAEYSVTPVASSQISNISFLILHHSSLIQTMVATIKSSLRKNQHILIRQLANLIEETWECNLNLFPYDIPRRFRLCGGKLRGRKLIIEITAINSSIS